MQLWKGDRRSRRCRRRNRRRRTLADGEPPEISEERPQALPGSRLLTERLAIDGVERSGRGSVRRSVRPTARRSPTCRSGCRASAFRFDRPAKHLRRDPEGHPALQERAVIDFPRRERLDQDGEFVRSACVHRSCLPLPVR